MGVGLLGLSVVLVSGAAESPVEINPDLRGAWVVPEQAWNGRAVLLFHGMASDMDDAGGSLKRLAEKLAASGIASLRINFRGEGDAMRTRIESTLTTRLEDAAAAYRFVRAVPGVAADRLGVMGFSLGATTAIITGARHPDWFRTMAVWSSPSGDQFAQWTASPTAQQALRDGEATEEIPGWKQLTTKREFYESFRGFDLDRELANYPGAFLSVRASEDMLPQHEAEFMKIAAGRRPASQSVAKIGSAEAVIIAGADHIFRVFQPELGLADRALAVTVDWFVRTL